MTNLKEKLSLFTAFLIIIGSGAMILIWKDYEIKIKNEIQMKSNEISEIPFQPKQNKNNKANILKKMAIKEREKIKVMVEHDNSPLTNTYPIILDATKSFDPDIGDKLEFVWKQISGPKIKLRPNIFSSKVSFEGEPGEYTFELQVSDNYGSEVVVNRTVIIEPEPNSPPVVDISIRQGSESN